MSSINCVLLNNSIGDISGFTNATYDSLGDFIQYCVDNGYLPDINRLPLIPTMTSNTAPSGVASGSGTAGGNDYYKAFDDNNTTWYNASSASAGMYIQYKFPNKVCVKKIYGYSQNGSTRWGSITIKGSNNGSNWTDIYTFDATNKDTFTEVFSNNTLYQYYRVVSNSNTDFQFSTLQMYGTFE